jgi:hypothetical protein
LRRAAPAWIIAILVPAALSAGVAPAPAVASGGCAGYCSPGYSGTKSFAAVAPAALPQITLGTGKYPNLLVDAAGTAHLVYDTDGRTTTQDTINYCSLQRGAAACAQTTPGLFPQEPEGSAASGNFPGANVDSQGAIPLVNGNQLFIADRLRVACTTPNDAVVQVEVASASPRR